MDGFWFAVSQFIEKRHNELQVDDTGFYELLPSPLHTSCDFA